MVPMTEDEKRQRVIEATRLAVPPFVLAAVPRGLGASEGRCLTVTRVGMEVLAYFGIESKPLVTSALSANAAWCEWQRQLQAGEASEEMPEEAWSVGVGLAPGEGRGINAHVVLLVGEEMIDLDAAQASRPERGMKVPTTVRLRWDPVRGAALDLSEGGVLVYLPHKDPPQFKHAPDWRRAPRLAGGVIRVVRKTIEREEVTA